MSQYSRKEKHQDSNKPSRSEKVKQSLSLFQMIVATIASLLGIIVTSFTIYSIMKPTSKTEEKKDSSTSHEKDGSATDSSATGTDTSASSNQASEASSEQTDSSQVETSASEAPAETTPSATDTESSANQ